MIAEDPGQRSSGRGSKTTLTGPNFQQGRMFQARRRPYDGTSDPSCALGAVEASPIAPGQSPGRVSPLFTRLFRTETTVMHALRLRQCLLTLVWTPQRLASELGCDLARIYALQSGSETLPPEICEWIEVNLHGKANHPSGTLTRRRAEEGKSIGAPANPVDERPSDALKTQRDAHLYELRLEQLSKTNLAQHPALRRSETFDW